MRLEVSTIKELPEMHRMGHTCANLNGELFFVWGGSDDRMAHLAICDNHLWIYETLTGYWRHRTCSGECPPYLSGTTCSLVGQQMLIFGGHSTAQDNWLNSLYSLDLDTFVWRDLGTQAQAEPTKPIPSDKCVSWTYDGRFYVFGGYGWSQTEHLLELLDLQKDLQLTPDFRWPKFGWNNQLVEFDLRSSKWRWPSYAGRCPSARAAHSGAAMGSLYYLFGGRDSRERLNDLYTFNMVTLNWNKIAIISEPDRCVARPIRHLLDPPEDEEEEIVAANAQMELEQQNEEMEQNPTPSSSSSNYPLQTSSQERDLVLSFDDSSSDDDDDNDDDDKQPFEYPHPSHLLERWSLSSHQSATTTNLSDAHNDCLEQESGVVQSQTSAAYPEGSNPFNQDNLVANLSQQQQQVDEVEMEAASLSLDNEISAPIDEQTKQQPTLLPPGRSFSSFTPISEDEIMLYGGVSSQNENLADCWLFNTKSACWSQIDLNTYRQPRLWHTGSRTKNNEVVMIGGSSSDKIDEFCSDVITIALEPRPLKKLALDTVAKSVRMRSIAKVKELPPTIYKLIKLRKQAMALTVRRAQRLRASIS